MTRLFPAVGGPIYKPVAIAIGFEPMRPFGPKCLANIPLNHLSKLSYLARLFLAVGGPIYKPKIGSLFSVLPSHCIF